MQPQSTVHALEQHIRMTRRPGTFVARHVTCADGFGMSVQASRDHYCEPRDDYGPWTSVEVAFLTRVEPLLWPYAQDPWHWTTSVYPRVPIELVAAVVELHGGLT